MFWYLTVIAILLLLYLIDYLPRWRYRHVPALPRVPILGSLPYVNPDYVHVSFDEWAHKLGSVYSFHPPGRETNAVVSSYSGIRDMLITKGKASGGRSKPFCSNYLLEGTGILFSFSPDQEWKSLRKASHKHLKQYGEGMTHLQNVIQDIQEDMFRCFRDNIGRPFDPKEAVFDAALNNIAFLLTGIKSQKGDSVLEMMREYEAMAPKFVGGTTDPKHMIYDVWPVLRHLRLNSWKDIERMKYLQDAICRDVEKLSRANPNTNNLFKVLISHVKEYDHSLVGAESCVDSEITYTQNAVNKTLVSLLFAGVTTTSTTFYAIVNFLAHSKSIWSKLRAEVIRIGKGKPDDLITMDDRVEMPYCRAIIFEALRYVTILPFGVPHRTLEDVEIDGFEIPKNTYLLSNLWTLHHSEAFWKDPYVFRPERFLDDDGQLVPVDHPNRKHLLPFGAGPRVCLGESMALARLFIWTATFAQRFTVKPAPGNVPSLTDPRKFKFEGLLRIIPYEVIFDLIKKD